MTVARDTTPTGRAAASRGVRVADAASRALGRWGVPAAIAGALAASLAQLVDYSAFGLRIRMLDMDTHASVFGVVSLLALLAALAVATLLAVERTTRTRASVLLPWLLTGLLALRVLHPAHVIVFALAPAAATLVILWRDTGAPRSYARRLIRAGCVVLLGSYAVHAFGGSAVSSLGSGTGSWAYQVELTIRHSAELAGWTLVAAGLASIYTAARGDAPASPA